MTWKYKGPGFFPGVPMRDLTDAEFAAAEELIPGIREAGVYAHTTHRPVMPEDTTGDPPAETSPATSTDETPPAAASEEG